MLLFPPQIKDALCGSLSIKKNIQGSRKVKHRNRIDAFGKR